MAKRSATSDINHTNWDDPYEAEEPGSFKTASQGVLQKRVIKVAKRSLKSSNESGKMVFASFPGFNSTTTNKPFGFLQGGTSSSTNVSTTNGSSLASNKSMTPEQLYSANLQELNRSVCNWIKTHVDRNPICILTPIFKDYEKHLKDISDERDASEKSTSTTPSSIPSFTFASSSTSEGHRFTINTPVTSADTTKKLSLNTDMGVRSISSEASKTSPIMRTEIGKSPLTRDSDEPKATPSFFSSFNVKPAGTNYFTKPDAPSLMVNPFTSVLNKDKAETNTNVSVPTSANNDKDEEEENDSDEPPKVEITPIHEEGSIFSTRCKVFVKKGDNYTERGVGTLFIKKVGENKHQLLVRAETVLGNIIINTLLTAGVPTQRKGKNNVMLVCLPTPQDLPPPTTVLLRVKTAEEADTLLSALEKYK